MGTFGQKIATYTLEPEQNNVVSAMNNQSSSSTQIYKTRSLPESPALTEFKDRVFELLLKNIDLTAAMRMPPAELRHEVERYIFEFTEETKAQLNHKELRHITDEIIHDMMGLGPLETLLSDSTINDIMVNAYDSVYIERQGQLMLTDVKFRSERHVLQVAQRIANQIGRRIDEASPMVDARLKDGSRVNIIIPPMMIV
jgi:pilus assembly protein CpaF